MLSFVQVDKSLGGGNCHVLFCYIANYHVHFILSTL
jgi:hypothetical protein